MNFFEIFKMNMKVFFRDRLTVFWMTLFPLLLITTFGTVFTNLRTPQTDALPVGISTENEYLSYYQEIPLLEVKALDGSPLDYAEALTKEEIIAFIDENNELFAAEQSIALSVVRSCVDGIKRSVELGPAAIFLNYDKSLIQQNEEKSDPAAVSLLAMFALYTFYSYFGTTSYCSAISAEQSSSGLRHEIAPISRLQLLIGGFISNLLYTFVFIFILKGYCDYVLNLNLLPRFWQSLPVLLSGAVCGASIGLLIGSIPRISEAMRINLGVFVSLSLAMLSGMMTPEIYILIESNAPLIIELNPLSRLTKSLFYINHLNSTSTSLGTTRYFLLLSVICLFIAGQRLGRLSHRSVA